MRFSAISQWKANRFSPRPHYVNIILKRLSLLMLLLLQGDYNFTWLKEDFNNSNRMQSPRFNFFLVLAEVLVWIGFNKLLVTLSTPHCINFKCLLHNLKRANSSLFQMWRAQTQCHECTMIREDILPIKFKNGTYFV